MNYIDIIILVIFAVAAFLGFRQGVITQLCSILSVVVGVWLGSRYGDVVGGWFGISGDYSYIVGFVIVVIAIIVAVAIVAFLLKKIFKLVGFGILDSVLGALLSLIKYCLVLSILLSAFDAFNSKIKLVDKSTITSSKLYTPVKNISSMIFPAVSWTQKKINSGVKK